MKESGTILIVDDDDNLVRTLSSVLRLKGYSSVDTATGHGALDLLEEQSIDVALIDLRLGDMSGLEVLALIKQRAPRTECIVLTGHASQASAIEAINLGAYSYVLKPYNLDHLLVTIRRALEKQVAEKALRESEEQIRTVVDASKDAMVVVDRQGLITLFNPAAERMFGRERSEVMHRPLDLLLPEDQRESYRLAVEGHFSGLESSPASIATSEKAAMRSDGTTFPVELSLSAGRRGSESFVLAVVRDITERRNLEDQLRQSQKMEAVGLLTGGIAHDFNNLLTSILGYCDLVLRNLGEGDPSRKFTGEIKKAGQRAAALTRQLLAFSRRQILEPKVLDINAAVVDIERMLRRMIGEDVELVTRLDPDLGRVKADPSQLEQVIMNLVVNARDAMAQGGQLTIETRNTELDEEYVRSHSLTGRGPHILIAVSDTGCGMDREMVSRIFEPFFTSKAKEGRGTGLGLSTVYGIVKQSDGHIVVESEPGRGTTMKVYLPQIDEEIEVPERGVASVGVPHGSETILLVEDDAAVREITRHVLSRVGYTVLEASGATKAMQMAEEYEGSIHLMLTDVVMPRTSGSVLAERLRSMRADMRVMFMSGYTDETISRHGIPKSGLHFIQKPFTPRGIAEAVRCALDSKPGGSKNADRPTEAEATEV